MSRFTALTATIAAVTLAIPASAIAANGTAKGRVIDKTCPGPCASGTNPHPFTGEAVVRIRSLPDRELVAEVPVSESRFEAVLPAGLYRFRAIPYPDEPRPNCWESDPRRATVEDDAIVRVRLPVWNACVV